MADKKISELTAIGTILDADLFAIVDVSASETKKGTYLQLKTALATDFGVAIPATRIAFGNSGGDGITSDADLTYDPSTGDFTTGNGVNSFVAKGDGTIYRGGNFFSTHSDGANFNTSWGINAGGNGSGTGNTTMGFTAGNGITTGSSISMFGSHPSTGTVIGTGTSAFGSAALQSVTGTHNTGLGTASGRANTTGSSNTYIGSYADVDDISSALSNLTGNYNVIIGALDIGGTKGTAFAGGNAFSSVFAVHGIGIGSNQIIFGGGDPDTFYESMRIGYNTGGDIRGFYFGDVDPEGAVAANQGSLYLSNESGTGKTYKKETGTGNTGWVELGSGGGSGTVTSFSAGDLSPLFTTSEATATTTPALSFSLNTQNANKVFAGPTNGADAAPTFRVLVAADIPSLSGTYLTIDGATTGATSQAQVFTSGIKTPVIDDNTAGSIEFSFSGTPLYTFSNASINAPNGTISAPAYSFSGDGSTGIYLKTANSELGASVNNALVGGFNTTGLFVGLAGTLSGTLKLSGSTSGTVTIQTAVAAGTWTLTLPTTDGNSGEYLQTDGAGVTTWAAVSVYTDEQAQDAVGAMIDTTLVYVDATPLLTRAALTGDVTAPQGSNTTTIANDAVTFAKMQNITTDRLLGRDTAASGDVEEISLGTGLAFSGSASIVPFGTAYTMLVNNTSGSAAMTLANYQDEAIATYGGTFTWTGSVSPATIVSQQFKWERIGSIVILHVNVLYTTPGTANTACIITLPATCPNPAVIANSGDAASEYMYPICGGRAEANQTANPSAVRGGIRRNAGNTAFEILTIFGSVNALQLQMTIIYATA